MKYFFLSLCILLGSFFFSSYDAFAAINFNPGTTTVDMGITGLDTQGGTLGFKAKVTHRNSTPAYSETNTLSVNGSGVAQTTFSGLTAGGQYTATVLSHPASNSNSTTIVTQKDFSTQAEQPMITSLQPNTGNQGQTMTVMINGINFASNATANFGANITNTITSNSPTLLKATIVIANNATAGTRNVTVTSGGMTTSPKIFTVVAPSTPGGSFAIANTSVTSMVAEPNVPNMAHVTIAVTFNGDPMNAPAGGIDIMTSTENPVTPNTVYGTPSGSDQSPTGSVYTVELSSVPLNILHNYVVKNHATGATIFGPKDFTATLNAPPPPTDACPEPGVQPTGPCQNPQNDVCTNQPGIQPPGTQCQTVLYTLLEPIFNVTAINTASDLATFFNFLFKTGF